MKIILTFALLSFLISCSEQETKTPSPLTVEMGDTVFVHYTGKVVDGEVFESTLDGEPRGIIVGKNEILPAFEQNLEGMRVGDNKSFTLTPEQGFGPYRDEPGMTYTMERSSLAHTINPVVGQQLNAAVFLPGQPAGESQIVPVVIKAVTDKTITVDANHPLAGKSLEFDVLVVDLKRE